MAMTGSLACSSATALAAPGTSQQVTCTLTVTNSAAVAINVISIMPYIQSPDGATPRQVAAQMGQPVLNAANQSVPGSSGTATFSWTCAFYGPEAAGAAGKFYNGANNATTQTFDIGAIVDCADGTTIVPTVQLVTVSQPPRTGVYGTVTYG